MDAKEIEFFGRRPAANAVLIAGKKGFSGWGSPLKLPSPVYIDGVLCNYVNLSEYGGMRFSQAAFDGKYHYLAKDKTLPKSIADTEQGFMLIPWGEPMTFFGCGGVGVRMYEADGNVVFDFVTRSKTNDEFVFQYRVEFPLREPNVVRVFYYHCVSRYNTYVGAVLQPDDFINWPLEETQPYMRKGIEILFVHDSSPQAPIPPDPEPIPEPVDPVDNTPTAPTYNTDWEKVCGFVDRGMEYSVVRKPKFSTPFKG